jgi:hypothetical protein
MTADTLHQVFSIYETLRACSKSGILALQTPKFYLAGSKRARKSGFLRSIDRKNPQFEQALKDGFVDCFLRGCMV